MRARMVVCVLVLTAGLGAQEPKATLPKGFTIEQQALLREAEERVLQAGKLRQQGKLAEAIVAAEKALAAQQKVLGEEHNATVVMLDQIATMQEELERFDESTITRERIQEIQTKRFGQEHWRVTDARVAINSLRVVQKLTSEQRTELTLATQDFGRMLAEYRRGNYTPRGGG